MTRRLASLVMMGTAAVFGCGSDSPGETYYERVIQPILVGSCSGTTSGCHRVDETDPFGFAAGNFDVTSFENVQKRKDLLRRFGAYNAPLLLVKAVGNTGDLGFNYRRPGDDDDEFIPLEVSHAVGASVLSVNSDAYLTLLQWTDNGATENGLPPPARDLPDPLPCSTFIPDDFTDAERDAILDDPDFDEFRSEVWPIVDRKGCLAGNCHGAPQADFYVTCGDSDDQLAFNFRQARAFVDEPVESSQILQMPLPVGEGGLFHSGGEHFDSRDDSEYKTLEAWAEKVGRVDFGIGDPGRTYFGRYVEPVLLKRGCSFEACHSPQSTNDFQLRSGSQGFFSAVALERNYHKLKQQFMAMEVPDARRGRAVGKTILSQFGGFNHRGGEVLETPGSGGAQPSSCSFPLADPATAPAYCVVQEWVDIERQALISAGDVDALAETDTVKIVYVQRNNVTDVASPLEFHVYQPNTDLMAVDATIGPGGALTVTGVPQTLLTNCAGAGNRTVVDVSGPDVRFDGRTVAFAMRTGDVPYDIYTVRLDTLACTRITTSEGTVSGIKIDNFNPAWSPDGRYIVYNSTRGGNTPAPTRSRKYFRPQSDLWRMEADGSDAPGQRMTVLTNSELSPQFMREGRVIMTTEKISEDFYQLSGRRMNWDLTDYHPLLAQRAQSRFGGDPPGDPDTMAPSVGYQQATEIREGFDGNFLLVFSDEGARGGGGTIGIFNRSAGTFEAGRKDPGFLRSVVIPDDNATGRVGDTTDGAWRSPFPLLDGQIMASYASGSFDLGSVSSLNWDLYALDPVTGQSTVLLALAGQQVEAVLAIKKPVGELYINRRQLVFGGFQDAGSPDTAIVHYPDAPLIFTLLTGNARRGRPASLFRNATQIALYQEGAAPAGTMAPNDGDIYQKRTLIGRADLADDGSVKIEAPSGVGIIMELQDASGDPVISMFEEHQLGPGENISFGIVERLFDAVCGGCHGTVSGRELDVFVTPDALTGASESASRDSAPQRVLP